MNVWFFIVAYGLGFTALAFGLNELRGRVAHLETRAHRGKEWRVIGNPWVWVVSFRVASTTGRPA